VEGLTLYRLPEIIAGDLDELIERLTVENQADELKLLTEGNP
jgi:peptide chain release factor 1